MTMLDINRSTLGLAAAVGGGLFLAYCVYFDHRRRNDPDFKKKLKARRQQKLREAEAKKKGTPLPDLSDFEAMQKFFIQEIQLGEELISSGDIENGIEHISNAVVVCNQPQQLLGVLQSTLDPALFSMLLSRLPEVSKKFASAASASSPIRLSTTQLLDDDVE